MTPEELEAQRLAELEAKKLELEKAEAARVAAEAEAARLAEIDKSIGKGNENDDEMVKRLVETRVQEKVTAELAEIKRKLDASYKVRDEALAKAAAFETKEREATIKRLEEEGKHKEVYEMKLAETNAKLAEAERKNTELSRDAVVRNALGTLPFRNPSAVDMAYREIVAQLVQNEQGVWVHRSGISVPSYVEAFAKNDDMAFLFKPRANSGAGVQDITTTKPSNKAKSLFEMSQDEVLKLAREGKLGNRG
jgi:multidrug efflux pump subunit AcrA (membrane-fusion protein)